MWTDDHEYDPLLKLNTVNNPTSVSVNLLCFHLPRFTHSYSVIVSIIFRARVLTDALYHKKNSRETHVLSIFSHRRLRACSYLA